VLLLHGAPTLRIWFTITGRPVMTAFGGAAAVALLVAAVLPGTDGDYLLGLGTLLVRFLLVTVLLSLLTCLYIRSVRIGEAIKNRKDTRLLFGFSTTLKAGFAVVLIVTGGSLWMQYANAADQREQLRGWTSTSAYGIFYPKQVGNDLHELQAGGVGQTTAEVYGLYPLLDDAGALYVDASQYSPDEVVNHAGEMAWPGELDAFRTIRINTNYLRAFPVRDVAGAPVEVPEAETDWVVLVPESYRAQADAITAHFQELRSDNNRERDEFGYEIPQAVRDQQVRIIWTATEQQMFSFDPEINPDAGNAIVDPIIEVMTRANSVGWDRANAFSGGPDSALKVKLIDGSTTTTLAALQPELRRLHLDDNLRFLVTLDEYAVQELLALEDGIRRIVIVAAGLLVVMLILVTQSLTLAFERYARKVVARRLFGLSFFRRHREFLVIFGVVWIAQVLLALLANAAGLTPFATATSTGAASPPVALVVALSALAVELAFSATVLVFIERRRTTDVLKGEF
jgi:putative ABC transport system permease protein